MLRGAGPAAGRTPELEREVFWQVATPLYSEVDLLLFDTTSILTTAGVSGTDRQSVS
jgi:hypothetical protein